jgi:hypothetical protein
MEPGRLMPTTFRADIRSGMYAALTAFQTAYPERLQEAFRVRPTHVNRPMPIAWVDILAESATHTAGTRERVLSPSIVFMGDPLENDAQADFWDATVDLLADHFTAYAQFAPVTIWSAWTVTDESEEVETAPDSVRTFPAVRFTFSNVSIREGRD